MTTEIEEKKKYLLHWMYDFIEDDDEPAYQIIDVEEFDVIITSFIKDIAADNQRSNFTWVSSKVELLVKTLNVLNQKHDKQLIETDQRQDICALISLVIEQAGHEGNDDITEQWREW